MEIKQLKYMVACARARSFSGAADLLYTSQSNVSKVVGSLERELGTALFERTRKGITLTEQGKQVYGYACSVLDEVQKISDSVLRGSQRELRICANASSWMARAFCDYYRSMKGTDVSFYYHTADTEEMIRRLSLGMDQIGFGYILNEQLPAMREKMARSHVAFQTMKETQLVLYFGNEEAYAHYRKREKGQPVFFAQSPDDGYLVRSLWENPEDRNREKAEDKNAFRIRVTTNSDYLMNELLRRTDLGNVSGAWLTEEENAAGGRGAYLLQTREPQKKIAFGALFRNDGDLDPDARQFLKFIQNRLSAGAEPDGRISS